MTNQTVAHVLAAALKRHGVTHVFGQSIPAGLLHVTPQYGIRQMPYRTENAGGIMADGFARISGRIGVVCAQNGPAATLLVPPLAEALKASIPILALVEDVPLSDLDRNAFQEFDHRALFASCTKWVRRLDHPDRAEDYIDMAVGAATSGRPGPVALMLARDLFAQPASATTVRTADLGSFPLDRAAPDAASLAEAARLIAQAERPIIIAGGGIHISGASEALAALVDLTGIPVATTTMGKGSVDDRAPLSLGAFGNTMGSGAAASHLRSYIANADLVLLVGTRTNQNGTDGWKLYPKGATFIHIDIDPIEVGRNYDSMRLVGDAQATLLSLVNALEKHGNIRSSGRRDGIAADIEAARRSQADSVAKIGAGGNQAIRPEYLMRILDDRLRAEDIVVADASYSSNWVTALLTSRKAGSRFLLPRGLAGLGWGLPLGMGAQVARPDSRVFAIVGDGGFAHCWSELEAARRMGLSLVTIVLNNSILGYQCHGENAFAGGHTNAVDLGPVDHAAIARACGCFGERVESPTEFEAALDRALASGVPAVLDVVIDPLACPPITMLEGLNVTGTSID